MKSNSAVNSFEFGFTLMEVILTLLITSILLVTSLRFLVGQWRAAFNMKNYLEAHYSVMTAGKTLSDSIRTSRTVEWSTKNGIMQVLPMPDDANPLPTLDSYFIADLDRDQIMDLYWKHLNVSQPIASNITSFTCMEVTPGLWEIDLKGKVEDQIVSWRTEIRRVMYTP